MIDTVKVKWLKRILMVVAFFLTLLLGIGFGQMGKSHKATPAKQVAAKKTEDRITQNMVKDFLMSYFTKKDLGENRERYKEYMTQGLYNATVDAEEDPTTKTYKGFVVDYKFKDARIYIDQKNMKVIAQVTYVNTLLSKKNNYEAMHDKDHENKTTLALDYTEVDGKLLIDHMSVLVLHDSDDPQAEYDAWGAIAPSESSESHSDISSSEPSGSSSQETKKEESDER